MFKRILIANRGGIAVRVFWTCRELEIEPMVIYSRADGKALHVQLAEQVYCIGPARSADSYLDISTILTVAQTAGCDAIHSGCGFFSENADFADTCEAAGITLIGPSGDVIRAMGNKAAAQKLMQSTGVPVAPDSGGAVSIAEQARALADSIGYPVLTKASTGGGGRGMRRMYEPGQLIPLFEKVRSESLTCFNSGEIYLKKLIVNPRHIEFQIMANGQGHVIQLGDRGYSIQWRNQKLLEESPSKALTPELRERMGAAATAAVRATGCVNTGIIEFMLAPDGQLYFIGMDAHIQVERPVTELVTGLDLMRERIRVSAGLPLFVTQKKVLFRGHAIKCRVNAEDPAKGFQPCPDRIGSLHLPGSYGVRVDIGLYTSYELPPYYDFLMAKLIAYAPIWLKAIRRMRRALEELIIERPVTSTDLLHQILHYPGFIRGSYSTSFLEARMDTLLTWNGSGEVREI